MKDLKIHVTDIDGTESVVDALEGWQVMEILRDHGFPIKAECGGACCCATCHIYIDSEWLPRIQAMSDDENVMLDNALQVRENSRLSCQIVMSEDLNGLRVTIAPNPQ